MKAKITVRIGGWIWYGQASLTDNFSDVFIYTSQKECAKGGFYFPIRFEDVTIEKHYSEQHHQYVYWIDVNYRFTDKTAINFGA